MPRTNLCIRIFKLVAVPGGRPAAAKSGAEQAFPNSPGGGRTVPEYFSGVRRQYPLPAGNAAGAGAEFDGLLPALPGNLPGAAQGKELVCPRAHPGHR